MGIPNKSFDYLLKQISDHDKKSLFDYMEYLASRTVQKAWSEIDEVDEPLSTEEKQQLQNSNGETIALEELRRELNL